MSRWKIGDRVLRPVFGPRALLTRPQQWAPAVVEIVRGDRVVVRSYCWEYEHAATDLLPPRKHGGDRHVRPHKRQPPLPR
jgi:hypothetical protein